MFIIYILFLATIYDFLVWLYHCTVSREKIHFVKRHLGIMSSFNPQEERQLAREFVLHYLKDDGVFVTRLLSVNSSDLVVTEIINQLWTRFKTVNRLYAPPSQSVSSTDNNINTSTPGTNLNYQNGNTPINNYRPRLSRIPPPPLPSFLHRKLQQQLINEKPENIHDTSKSAKDTDV
ncbi:unnamed protein product [Rotaria socialis]|uniref:Innexin n=1 Tax=Rotaria socialis TaxID=392032 RepID=A0A820CV12_9BILA|nr:unnamed protein product [Rotaria socialis]